jgi:uncharacterized protein YraI
MSLTKFPICAAALVLMATGSSSADPAYVPSAVNLREAAGTGKPVLAKIPAGSRLEATNCNDWCEVEWQGKKGFVIANALDRSGKAAEPRPASKSASEAHTTGSVAQPAAEPSLTSKSTSEPRTTGSVAVAQSAAEPSLTSKSTSEPRTTDSVAQPAAEPRSKSKSASGPRTTGSVAHRAPPRRPRVYVEDDYVPMGPPVVYGRPYYYPYRPYVYAYRPYYYGYRRGYYRW